MHQYDEELNEVKKTRRKGRPASVKEDLLKVKIENLQKEWQNGFRQYSLSPTSPLSSSAHLISSAVVPVLDTEENAELLNRWEGSWSYLTTLKWVRVSCKGTVQPSSFPPRGDH